ncbi:hypothetical protein HCN44_005013 [Aphidius gifuensis]|uniref:Cytochrome P450 n=1 Tax=Aphidius gifuensis TaxID=684658 RepID=A0A835CQ97_APHGI|nr:hypothetical protein HCN44_005013 [Aphidius gifuensis]
MLVLYLSVVILLITWIIKKKYGDKLNLPPGPKGLPIVGYLPWLDAKAPHESLTLVSQKYGKICGLWMGSVYTVLLSDPKIIRQTLARDTFSGRAPLYLTHGIMKGYGIICAEGELWKEQRKFVTTTLKNLGMVKFGSKRDQMEERIVRSVNELIENFKENLNIFEIDPLEILHHCIGNLMNDIVFGKVYNENDETWKWLRFLQEDGIKHIGIAGPLNFLPFLRFIPKYNKVMNFLIEGKLKTHKIYKNMIEEHEKNPVNCDNFLAAFNDEIIKKRNENNGIVGSFTEQQYYHLLADICGAGTDTSLMTIRWFLLYMATNPEQQEKIYQDIFDVMGDKEITLNDRSKLVRLESSICEVQRIRSIVPIGIPHGCTMVVPLLWSIHMSSEYFKNPEEFNHDRFLNDDGTFKKSEAFIPFQTGKRVCVGDELARMILFLYAGRILQNYKISIPKNHVVDLRGDIGITLIPKPHKLVFSSRL